MTIKEKQSTAVKILSSRRTNKYEYVTSKKYCLHNKHLLRHFKNRKRQLRNSGKFKLKALQSLYWDDQQMQMHQAQIVYIEELFPRDHLNREAH